MLLDQGAHLVAPSQFRVPLSVGFLLIFAGVMKCSLSIRSCSLQWWTSPLLHSEAWWALHNTRTALLSPCICPSTLFCSGKPAFSSRVSSTIQNRPAGRDCCPQARPAKPGPHLLLLSSWAWTQALRPCSHLWPTLQPSFLCPPCSPKRVWEPAASASPGSWLEMQITRPGECKWCSRQIRRRLSSRQHSGVCWAWWGNRAFSPHLPPGQVSACSTQGSPEGQALRGFFLRPPPSPRHQQVLCRIPVLSTWRQLSPCGEGWAKGCTTTGFPRLILNLDPPAGAVSERLPHLPPPSSHLMLMAPELDQPTSRGKEVAAIARGVQVSTLSPGRRTRRME